MKQALTTLGELVGGAIVALGFGMLAPWLGVVVLGALVIAICFAVSL